MSEHTPTPWAWDSDPLKGDELLRVRYRICAIGRTITQMYYPSSEGDRAEADTRHIIQCVNERDQLLDRVKRLEGALRPMIHAYPVSAQGE